MATQGNARITLSAEDRTAAAFAAVGKRVDKLGFNLTSLKGAATGALAALSVPITAGAIVGLASEAAKAIDELKGLGEATGSSVENISALDKIARSTGGTFENVSGVLIKFNDALKNAERTKEIGAILKALNLNIEDLRRLDPAEALQKTAIALETFADNGDKARAVQELFGRSVKDAAPFLRDLAEAGTLNATVTAEQAEEVDRFNKQLARLQSNAQDVARSLSVDLITALNRLIDRFQAGEKAGKGFLATAFQVYSQNVAEFYGATPKPPPGFDPNDQSAAELARLTRRPTLSLPGAPEAPARPRRVGGGRSSASTPKDPFAEATRYLEGLQKQLEATDKLSEVETALRDIQLGRLGALKPGQEQAILDTARLIDADRELLETTKEFAELEKQAIDRKRELAEAGARVYEETRSPLEKLNVEVAELQRLLDAGAISFDTFARKNFDLEAAIAGIGKEVTELDKFTQQAAANIQDAFGDTFAQILDGNFKDIGSSFTSLINKMVAEAAAAQLSKYLFGDLAGGGGGGDGIFGKALGSFASSIFGGAPKFATGTDFVPRDMLAMVHKGEAIIPAQRNTAGFGGGQSISVSQTFTVGNNVDRRTQMQIAAEAQRGLRAAARNL